MAFYPPVDRSYLSYLINQIREWCREYPGFCTIESRKVFECPLSAPAQSFLLCGNFVQCAAWGHDAVVAGELLGVPLFGVTIHGEEHELATVSEAVEWLENERTYMSTFGKPIHPGCRTNLLFACQMMQQLLDQLDRAARRYLTGPQAAIATYELESLERLHNEISEPHARSSLVLAFRQALQREREVTLGDVSLDLSTAEIGEQLVQSLYRWARIPPLHLPDNSRAAEQISFLYPRVLMEGRVREVIDHLWERGDDVALMVLRELMRIANMSSFARGRYGQIINDIKSDYYLREIVIGLSWLTSPLKRHHSVATRVNGSATYFEYRSGIHSAM